MEGARERKRKKKNKEQRCVKCMHTSYKEFGGLGI